MQAAFSSSLGSRLKGGLHLMMAGECLLQGGLHLLPAHGGGFQELVKDMARRPNKGDALLVLLAARSLRHEHDRGL